MTEDLNSDIMRAIMKITMNKNLNKDILNIIMNDRDMVNIGLVKALIVEKLKRGFNNKICYYADCKKNPICSHTISKTLLNKISENKNVYTFQPSDVQQKIYNSDENNIYLKKTTINGATCFPGFCHEHDNNLFKLLEDPVYIKKGSQEDYAFLYSYRNLCHDLWIERSLEVPLSIKPKNKMEEINLKIANFISEITNTYLNIKTEREKLEEFKKIYEKYIESDGTIIPKYKTDFEVHVKVLDSMKIKFAGITITKPESYKIVTQYPVTVGILPECFKNSNLFFMVNHKNDTKECNYIFNNLTKLGLENLVLYKNQNLVISPEVYRHLDGCNELPYLYKYLNETQISDLNNFQDFDLF